MFHTHTSPVEAGDKKWSQPRSSDVVLPFQAKLHITVGYYTVY